MAPEILETPFYQMLRGEDIKGFNAYKAAGNPCELRRSDLRGLDLRGVDADGLDLRDCYLRGCDLRGVDFRNTLLEGASINSAKISGTYFPKDFSAEEITLSLLHGTRLRMR